MRISKARYDAIERLVVGSLRQADQMFEAGLRRSMSDLLSLPGGLGNEIDQHDDIIATCRQAYGVERAALADRLRQSLRASATRLAARDGSCPESIVENKAVP